MAVKGRNWPLRAGLVLAGLLAVYLIVGQIIPPGSEVIASGDTELRIELGRSSNAQLAPHSSLTIAGRDATELSLDGSARFVIEHNLTRNLRIAAGPLTVSDVGTRFAIEQGEGRVVVAVEEGEVAVTGISIAQPLRITAGRTLTFDIALRQVTVVP